MMIILLTRWFMPNPTQEAVGRFTKVTKTRLIGLIVGLGTAMIANNNKLQDELFNAFFKENEALFVKELSAAYERGRKEGIKLESKKHCRFIGVTTIDGKRWCEEHDKFENYSPTQKGLNEH